MAARTYGADARRPEVAAAQVVTTNPLLVAGASSGARMVWVRSQTRTSAPLGSRPDVPTVNDLSGVAQQPATQRHAAFAYEYARPTTRDEPAVDNWSAASRAALMGREGPRSELAQTPWFVGQPGVWAHGGPGALRVRQRTDLGTALATGAGTFANAHTDAVIVTDAPSHQVAARVDLARDVQNAFMDANVPITWARESPEAAHARMRADDAYQMEVPTVRPTDTRATRVTDTYALIH